MELKRLTGKYQPQVDLANRLEIVQPDKELLLPGELGATVEAIVRKGIFNPEGKITNHIGPRKSESFTRQFMDFLWAMFINATENNPIPIRNTSNVLKNVGFNLTTFSTNAAAGIILNGIVVGTGAVAPDISDFALGTIILHDAAPPTANRMQYSIVTYGAPAADATTSQFTITRSFANASGGLITVTETGIYVKNSRGDTAAPDLWYFMTCRDVWAGIAVPTGQTLTINYRPQAVV